MGIKISAPELDDCVPGTPLFVSKIITSGM